MSQSTNTSQPFGDVDFNFVPDSSHGARHWQFRSFERGLPTWMPLPNEIGFRKSDRMKLFYKGEPAQAKVVSFSDSSKFLRDVESFEALEFEAGSIEMIVVTGISGELDSSFKDTGNITIIRTGGGGEP